jgi:hypothetical protein
MVPRPRPGPGAWSPAEITILEKGDYTKFGFCCNKSNH